MKLLVNKKNGMVAVEALQGMLNRKKGDIFGCSPSLAARLIEAKNVKALSKSDLPDDVETEEVDGADPAPKPENGLTSDAAKGNTESKEPAKAPNVK